LLSVIRRDSTKTGQGRKTKVLEVGPKS
jgi:hypothetical protein